MTLKEARKLGIRYCEENKCNYAYISYDKGNYSLTDKECADTVFLVNSINGIDLHTLYSLEGKNYNQCNFKNIKIDTVQSYLCMFDESEISFYLTQQRQNIPKDSQVYEINGYYFCVVDIRDTNTKTPTIFL